MSLSKIINPISEFQLINKANEIIDNVNNKYDSSNPAGYITGITSSMVTTALGYTPYSSANPSGYTSNIGTVTGIMMNGENKGTSGIIDLGTVITDISGKQDNITGAASTITSSNLTAYRTLVSNINGKVVASDISSTKLNYLTDVTSNIQAQINSKQDSLNYIPENQENKVNSMSASSTDTQYPSAKAVFNRLQDSRNLVFVTYSELVALKSNSQLKEGTFYRITDYVTTTNGGGGATGAAMGSTTNLPNEEPTRSAGHQFDIIIQAVGVSDLTEIGTAALHEGDTYFANSNLGGWQIWYDIDNNVNKYGWADTTNGKGVIYRMIDENNNDLPYDFKNIQFYRDKTASRYAELTDRLLSSDNYYYTFTYFDKNSVGPYDLSIKSDSKYSCCYNKMELIVHWRVTSTSPKYSQALNNNIFILKLGSGGTGFISNYFGNDTYQNTFCNSLYATRFIRMTKGNISQGTFNDCYITLFSNNTIGNGVTLRRSIISGSFTNNTINSRIEYSAFNGLIQYINFSTSLSKATIGNISGTSSNLLDLTGIPTGQSYSITICTDVNNNYLVTWMDLGTIKGVYKSAVTDTSWTPLPG